MNEVEATLARINGLLGTSAPRELTFTIETENAVDGIKERDWRYSVKAETPDGKTLTFMGARTKVIKWIKSVKKQYAS